MYALILRHLKTAIFQCFRCKKSYEFDELVFCLSKVKNKRINKKTCQIYFSREMTLTFVMIRLSGEF